MRTCTDCGGDADRGWTDGEAHTQCCMCEIGAPLATALRPELVARLVLCAAQLFEVDPHAILAQNQHRPIVRARAAVCATLLSETPARIAVIARLLNRARKTIICAAHTAQSHAARDPGYAKRLARLRQEARHDA